MTVVLTSVTVWVARSVLDGTPDDVTPVRDSLVFLRSSLDGGSGEAAQELFPEGYYFSHALHGLAITDLAEAGHIDPGEARRQARLALDRLESPAGTQAFHAGLRPTHGVFYAGWTLLLRAQAAALAGEALDGGERDWVTQEADALASAFGDNLDRGGSPFLMAYPNQSWPVDSVVAVAALRRADRVSGDDHGPLIERWLARAAELHDPRTGLLPHKTDHDTGRALEGARATSQSIIQRLWPIVDPASAPETYRRFRTHFVASSSGFGGSCVRVARTL